MAKYLQKGIVLKLTIIGNGAMAIALADGLREKHELEFIIRDEKKIDGLRERYDCEVSLLDENDISGKNLLLCVKPYALTKVSSKLRGEARVLYSILAGTTIESLKNHISATDIVRAMPNLAATFGLSATSLTGDDTSSDEAKDLFGSIGTTVWLSSEKELDIATAIAGSGPAYLALVAEAMMDGGVKQGLRRDDSMRLVEGLFGGFAPMLSDKHPALIKDAVMSPGGTTAAGYSSLEEAGVRDGFIKAVESAFRITQK